MSEHSSFQITAKTDHTGITIVSLEGEILSNDARRLSKYFRELYSRGVRDVVIDMSAVTYACSAALAFFIAACSGYTKDEIKFNAAFCGLPVNVSKSVESLGLAHLLRIADDREAAIKLLSGK